MTEHISAEDYRNQFVKPALEEEAGYLLPELKVPNFHKIVKKNDSATEHDIQDAILEHLSYIKGFFWRENSGVVPITDKYGSRQFRGGIKGVSDILGVYKGRFVAIEVKRFETQHNISLPQMAFMEAIKLNGGIAFVCYDPATVIEQLEKAFLE